jgi:hypothetical protein
MGPLPPPAVHNSKFDDKSLFGREMDPMAVITAWISAKLEGVGCLCCGAGMTLLNARRKKEINSEGILLSFYRAEIHGGE